MSATGETLREGQFDSFQERVAEHGRLRAILESFAYVQPFGEDSRWSLPALPLSSDRAADTNRPLTLRRVKPGHKIAAPGGSRRTRKDIRGVWLRACPDRSGGRRTGTNHRSRGRQARPANRKRAGRRQAGRRGDRIGDSRLEADAALILASDGHHDYPAKVGDNMAIALSGTDKDRVTTIFNDLAAGGPITMPLAEQPLGADVGWLTDKFGITSMVSLDGLPERSAWEAIRQMHMYIGIRIWPRPGRAAATA